MHDTKSSLTLAAATRGLAREADANAAAASAAAASQATAVETGAAQRTLAHAISCVGVGRHSGVRVGLTLQPAPAGSGVRFRRSDRPGSATLLACPEHLIIADHALILADGDGTRIVGVEHVTAALALTGIDNALIEVSGPELPAMDGSAQPFVFLIECAGATRQAAPRRLCPMPAATALCRGEFAARIAPASPGRLVADISETPEAAFGPAHHAVALSPEALRHELAAARQPLTTTALEAAQERGLMRGVSHENTLILDKSGPRNPGGLRFVDEPARHANLLALGALALLGGLPMVELGTRGASHALLARLLRQCGTSRKTTVVSPAVEALSASQFVGTQA
jgi:UDP-3-O-[3-hydroxymyristoyl] N-acetylglucosamine deacetylase